MTLPRFTRFEFPKEPLNSAFDTADLIGGRVYYKSDELYWLLDSRPLSDFIGANIDGNAMALCRLSGLPAVADGKTLADYRYNIADSAWELIPLQSDDE